jgi:fructose-1,6-bisphosphatase II / sedoheptulose-1,7-bisphosphatase
MSKTEQSNGVHGPGLERILVLELARVTEAAAIAAAQLRGRGNEKAADKAAVDAMRKELGRVEIDRAFRIAGPDRNLVHVHVRCVQETAVL